MKHYKYCGFVQAIQLVRSNYDEIKEIFDNRPDCMVDLDGGGAHIQMRLDGNNIVVRQGYWLLRNSNGKMIIMSNETFEFFYQEMV